jgi:hypothetical protein
VKNITNHNGHDGIYNQRFGTSQGRATLASNAANFNTNLGIESVSKAADGSGNRAHGNGNLFECTNVLCGPWAETATGVPLSSLFG